MLTAAGSSVGSVVDDDGGFVAWVSDTVLRSAVLERDGRAQPVLAFACSGEQSLSGERPPVEGAVAVVMAGGRGERLRPLTDTVPKALLTLGGQTILERLLEQVAAAGITTVYLSVHYRAELIRERIGDGAAFGLEVDYLYEDQPLHTAGVLSLLPARPAGPLLVLNAKLVTSLRLARALEFFAHEQAPIVIGAMNYGVPIPYGVLDLQGHCVRQIHEKPVLRQWCNAGLYILDPTVLDLVPANTRFGMDELINAARHDGQAIVAFPIVESVISISTRTELDEALIGFATGAHR